MADSEARESEYLRGILDAIPSYLLLVDEQLRVLDCNAAALELTRRDSTATRQELCGELLHCLHEHESPRPCGETEHCDACVLRRAVGTAMSGARAFRQKTRMTLVRDGGSDNLVLLVSAATLDLPEGRAVLLSLEDITELEELRAIIPVCASCNKVRNDEDYWESVWGYLGRRVGVEVTHGLCPDCAVALYTEPADTSASCGHKGDPQADG